METKERKVSKAHPSILRHRHSRALPQNNPAETLIAQCLQMSRFPASKAGTLRKDTKKNDKGKNRTQESKTYLFQDEFV